MKIAIPIANGQLCAHFGHCDQFALLEIDPASRKIISREDVVPPPHEPGLLPRWLAERGATMIIAGGMGQRARMLFVDHQIEVVVGAQAGVPEKLALDYLAGTLVTGDNICDH
jgi:predicted Fe-Mo cluster-binding NifX family protein